MACLDLCGERAKAPAPQRVVLVDEEPDLSGVTDQSTQQLVMRRHGILDVDLHAAFGQRPVPVDPVKRSGILNQQILIETLFDPSLEVTASEPRPRGPPGAPNRRLVFLPQPEAGVSP